MRYDPDTDPGAWGGAGRFMLAWALTFYTGRPNGVVDVEAGDAHLAIALRNVRTAWRLALQQEAPA